MISFFRRPLADTGETMNKLLMRILCVAVVSFLSLVPAAEARADERYFAIFFGAESKPYRPKYTHTWACVVKLTGEGEDLDRYQCQVDTCSWLPATLDVKVWKLWPERGVNLDLHSTIRMVLKNHEEISQWGPYELRKESYEKGMALIRRLNSGAVRYRAIDGVSRSRNISNCFHAISDLDPEYGRRRFSLLLAGERVTEEIIERVHERGVVISRSPLGDWLDHRLGLDAYPIVQRRYRQGAP
jgi:hypothetical protein